MSNADHGSTAPRLIFVHIPKSGGTTLDQVLNRRAQGKVCWLLGTTQQVLDRISQCAEEELLSYELFAGHIPFGLHALIPAPCRYITILRDPVERLVSHYYHVLDKPGHPSYQRIAEGGVSLIDFVSGDFSLEVDNLQTRFIAGLDANRATPLNGCTEELLRTAIQNLDTNFDGVLVQEYFDHSLLLHADAMGWRSAPVYTSKRVHKSRPRRRDIPAEVREVAATRNRFDVSLHRLALQRVEAAIKAGGAEFQDRLERFRVEREAWAASRPRKPANA